MTTRCTNSIVFLSSSAFSFLTDEQFDLLRANGLLARLHEERGELFDPLPVVKLYVPDKVKRTELIDGPPAQAAAELVRRLREEARVLE